MQNFWVRDEHFLKEIFLEHAAIRSQIRAPFGPLAPDLAHCRDFAVAIVQKPNPRRLFLSLGGRGKMHRHQFP